MRSLLNRVKECEARLPLDGDGLTWVRRPGGLEPVIKPQAAAAVAAESSVAWVKLTGLHADSRATGVRVYTGTLYTSPEATSGTAGVTIRIPSVAADWTAPASGVWTDLPFFSALPSAETWTGATASHTETVYWLLDPFRWY